MRLSVLLPAALLSLMPLACGGSEPDPNDPSQMQNQYGAGGQYPPGQFGQQPPGQYGQQPPGQYGQQPPGQYGQPNPQPTQPAPTQPAPQSSGGQATPVAPAAAAAATPILTSLAASDVQGMQAEGGAFAGQFTDGQTLEHPFQIQPGKCYSVIGAGLGIQELDIQLVAQAGPMPVVLAQDNSTGANATLGGKGQCFKNMLPIGGPAKVVLKVRGQGLAIGQLYVK